MNRATVDVPAGKVKLTGDLNVPQLSHGIVLFAHGSGSGRLSPRNQFVAEVLRVAGLATLLIDLLTKEEEDLDRTTGHLRFNIRLLADRLIAAIDWLGENPATRDLALGCFGASTGAGAALVAAAERPKRIQSVVSRGGRPDLAGDALERVEAPTLLIVGGNDLSVPALNQKALTRLNAVTHLEIVPRASHLFEEPGSLEQVARLARDWFLRYLVRANETATV